MKMTRDRSSAMSGIPFFQWSNSLGVTVSLTIPVSIIFFFALHFSNKFNEILLCVLGKKCIAHVVCNALSIDTSKWNLFREVVRENIRIRRANSNTAMKKEFFGKCIRKNAIFVCCNHVQLTQ